MKENIYQAIFKHDHTELKNIIDQQDLTIQELSSVMHNAYECKNVEAYQICFEEIAKKHNIDDISLRMQEAISYALLICRSNTENQEYLKFSNTMIHFILDKLPLFSNQQRTKIAESGCRNMIYFYDPVMENIINNQDIKTIIYNLSLYPSISADKAISHIFEISIEQNRYGLFNDNVTNYILNHDDMSKVFSTDIVKCLFYNEHYDEGFKMLKNFDSSCSLMKEECPLFCGIICQLLAHRELTELKEQFFHKCIDVGLIKNDLYSVSSQKTPYLNGKGVPIYNDYFNSKNEFVLKTEFNQNAVLFNSHLKYASNGSESPNNSNIKYGIGQFTLIENKDGVTRLIRTNECDELNEKGIVSVEQYIINKSLHHVDIDVTIKKNRL